MNVKSMNIDRIEEDANKRRSDKVWLGLDEVEIALDRAAAEVRTGTPPADFEELRRYFSEDFPRLDPLSR